MCSSVREIGGEVLVDGVLLLRVFEEDGARLGAERSRRGKLLV